MHFEILVEDQSGKKAIDILVPKIIGNSHTFRVLPYKGIGRIPRNMKDADDARKRILLENLPKLLKGYGRAFNGYPDNYPAALSSRGWQTIGAEKSRWAESISAFMDVMNNASPSFCYFRDKLRELAGVME